MREILFRGKRKDNGKWIEGDLSRCVVVGETHICKIEYNLSTTTHRIDPETVCQYTGLTDKNGIKIFEGDIVDSNGTIGIVKFGKYKNGFHYGFYIEWTKCPLLRQELSFWNGISKVVDNIFDNPELIKERRGDTYGEME